MGALGMPMVEIVSGMELFGGIELEYLEPLKVGDRIGVSSKIIDITNKKGRSGEMVFITRESEFRNQDAQVALYMRHRMVILDRKVT
jgi:hydroxyacyl-ACP dehydratase HTD2-like protein with hotdog domain